ALPRSRFRSMFRFLTLAALLVAGLSFQAAASSPPPRVVVSVKPLHSLVSGIMQGAGEPYLLVRGAASPHAFALRPSDARAVADAQLIVWAGPMMETFLERPLSTLARGATLLTLSR